jgi:hypothetical protein
MSQPTYLSVRNWKRFQHYHQRNPPWIRLYNALLDDYAFSRLHDASKWHAVGIWLLASRFDNRIPDDAMWIAQRINARVAVDLEPLLSAGFIERCPGDASNALAGRKQSATPEGEGEGETETEENNNTRPTVRRKNTQPYPPEFEETWQAYPKREGSNSKKGALRAWQARLNEGIDPADLLQAATRYKAFCDRKATTGTAYVMQGETFFGPNRRWDQEWGVDELGEANRKLLRSVGKLDDLDLGESFR